MSQNTGYDVIIIGSGLGGLVSGALLAKEGFKVLILERGKKIGGLLHNFKREQTVFNTGMNYIGALEKGGFLWQYFEYLGIMNSLQLKQLDLDAFEEISFQNNPDVYHYAQGRNNFENRLADKFPLLDKEIHSYTQKIWDVSGNFPLLYLKNYDKIVKGQDYLNGGASEFIDGVTKNQQLRSVLGATNSLYGGIRNTTPLYVHSLVNRQFIESAWRFVNGSQQLADALSEKIIAAGGIIMNKTEVVSIDTQDLNNSFVETQNGERYFGKNIISNIHPSKTLGLINDPRIKSVYRKRIGELPNTTSFFSMFLVFKPQSFPYLNRNYYHFLQNDVWDAVAHESQWPGYFMFYTGCNSHEQQFADNATVLSPMSYKEVEKWRGTQKSVRGDEYEEFKKQKSEALLSALNQKFSGIKEHIQSWYAATPLSYEHYTNAPEGTAYGIVKDHQNPYKSIILPKTKIPNLFFTGQNLNMHGALGVTIGAVLTSAELVGLDYLIKKIRNSL